jgi:hypothetical protein
MKRKMEDISKKIIKPKVIMRKTYQKKSWWKKIVLVIILILVIFLIIFSFIKYKKNKITSVAGQTNPIEIKSEGKVVERNNLDDILPNNSEVISQGEFNDVEQKLQGKALLIKSGEDIFLRLENFGSVNGQDMHVYLSPILNLDPKDVIDVGILKATSGNMNYKLDKNINLEKYNNVLIWSNRFSAFFGYAKLQK